MNKFLLITSFFVTVILAETVPAQEIASVSAGESKTEKKTAISEAAKLQDANINEGNKLLAKGDFNGALPAWLKALKEDKDNSNISFKLGLCYHNSREKQAKALPYFINAVKDMTDEYNFNSTVERKAPYDAVYFLAEAYMQSNQHEQALKHFLIYKDEFKGSPPVNVDKRIRECMNAKDLVNTPLNVKFTNAGEDINTGFFESNPVLTLDNSMLFISSRRPRTDGSNKDIIDKSTNMYYEDIYIAQKAGESWKKLRLFEHSTNANEAPLYITSDGNTLFLRREEKGTTNLYQTTYSGGSWSVPQKLNSNINSSANETGLTVSPDGNVMYFASSRDGGYGKSDIYKSTKLPGGEWGKAVNMGGNINTEGDELNPFMHPNGKKLYFSSNGWYNKGMGGYDIFFIALQDDGNWSVPQNIGYPINSTRDDMNFYIAADGIRYTTAISDNFNSDVYFLEEGKFDKDNLKPGTVIELQKELEVMDIIELEKEVEKEVEVLEIMEIETEVEKEVEIEKEVEVVEIIEVEKDPAFAKAAAEKAKAEAEIKKAEAEKLKAEAVIAEAEKLKAEAVIAETEKLKAEAELKKAEATIAESEKAKADAEKAKADALKAKEEKKIAIIYRKAAKDSAKVAEVNLAREAAKLAQAESEKVKAEAEKLKAEAEIAAKEKAEAEAEKAKADAVIAASKKSEADAKKAEAEKEKAASDAKIAKAEAEKKAAEAIIAEAEKAKQETEKVKQEAEKAKAEKDKSLADKAEAETKLKAAESEKAKAEAELQKEKAAAEKAKEKAEKEK